MNYLFKIQLCGHFCNECFEPLSEITVRLYSRSDEETANLAAANPKTTFSQLNDAQVKHKAPLLLAEGVTDEEGKVDLQLDDKYDGKAFDVDIQLTSSGEGDDKGKSRHLHLTTLAPTWRKYEDKFVAVWDYCLPQRICCLVLALLGRWVICGRVIHCESHQPVGGVEVSAFDRDWLQDDPLGKSLTDSDGRFLIEYTEAVFRPGTWIDIELVGGPDVYFHVRHPHTGAPLLIEPPSKGREPGRENVGHCFCVTLCLDGDMPHEDVYPPPVFTHIGAYNHQTHIDSSPGSSGLTLGDGRAFYNTIRLNGTLPKKFAGGQMEYCFDVREMQSDGTAITSWTPVSLSQIPRTVIGHLLKYAPAYPGDPNPIKSKPYTVNGNPGELEANVVAGWIRVPQESNAFGPGGFFQPNGNQITLDTESLGTWADVDLTGLVTGNSSTSTGQALVQNRYFALRMRVRKVGDPGSEQVAGVCQHLAVNNTLYDNILRHPAWMAQHRSDQLAVVMVDIGQLVVGGGCAEIENDLDVKFTAAHPTMGNVVITMSGPGGPYSFNLPGAVPGEQYGTATPNGFVVADLAPCAYIVTLRVQVLLTTGDDIPDDRYDQIAFCKA
ncbi:hypothetical protein [Desulfonema magnum]|uniref:Carboxypeptidase regulatory-like domain-containing protein n=1 Tax=Desulfonema magnum TaxID=45655 RepID=A0A975BEW1_9BACT|nr:hypothetical protein [Desulfonema magnum]QTA84247.1 Uncharacterized protein dnm_002410 [Desulfonema magnum]